MQAMVKARGDGIAFDLRKADFRLEQADSHGMTSAVLLCDGKPMSRYGIACELVELINHWVQRW